MGLLLIRVHILILDRDLLLVDLLELRVGQILGLRVRHMLRLDVLLILHMLVFSLELLDLDQLIFIYILDIFISTSLFLFFLLVMFFPIAHTEGHDSNYYCQSEKEDKNSSRDTVSSFFFDGCISFGLNRCQDNDEQHDIVRLDHLFSCDYYC